MANILQFDLVDAIRICFLAAAVAILIAYAVPDIRRRFFAYGARASDNGAHSSTQQHSWTSVDSLLDSIALWQVPHNWFISFYVLSTVLSVFWVMALPSVRPMLLNYISEQRSSTPALQQSLAYLFMALQGLRRLAECLLLTTSSKSSMWVGHWLVGLAFYVGMSIAIWIEGVVVIGDLFSLQLLADRNIDIRTIICAVLFVGFSLAQNECHRHLAALKSQQRAPRSNDGKAADHYRVPDHPLFTRTLTPHYLFECLIYLDLAVLAAPAESFWNVTISCAAVFVAVNLGVTASGTYQWYVKRFGPEAIRDRWAMVPFLF